MQRRDFLLDVARLAVLTAVVPNDWRVILRPRLADDPFQLGIASGDPTPSSVMLWTRLAPRPQEPEGGMTGVRVGVNWEVADEPTIGTIVDKSFVYVANSQWEKYDPAMRRVASKPLTRPRLLAVPLPR